MAESIFSRLQHAWNAFTNRDPTPPSAEVGYSSYRPDRYRSNRGSERSIINSIYTRIAIDVAAIDIKHVRLDYNDRYLEDMPSGLNSCLTLEANIDQTGRALRQDMAMSLLDEGCIAIVPTDTTINPKVSGSYDITSIRVGKITAWYPKHVKVLLYNENTGLKSEVVLPKRMVGIVENPLYAVMNEPNSTLQRLLRKLSLLDIIEEQGSSGKLDLIIQLPYVVRSDEKRKQAEKRLGDLEKQLAGSKYGVAYTDGTERIVQLNRSLENNLIKTIEYLTNMLYSQLGITAEVLSGTADEKVMLNYHNRTVEPIVAAITDEMKRKFLTKTGRSQGQSIMFFKDPFKLVPVNNIADIADKFTRNEILSSNEVRQIIGMKPSDDPKADELRNKNINQAKGEEPTMAYPEEEVQNEY